MQAIAWLHCIVAVCRNTDVLTNSADGNADGNTDVLPLSALLLDRRLIKAKGQRLTSFIGGGVLAFLPDAPLFPDSTVLAAVPSHTLEVFTSLIHRALGHTYRRLKLLFRSSRDGASAAAFHSRCDAQGPTLTLIKDTDGNVFGGYASVQWSSLAADAGSFRSGIMCYNDPAAFLFTVVNPHADPPALFPSKADGYSIRCDSSFGPCFRDLYVSGAFDGGSSTNIGYGYALHGDATRHSGETVLTGARHFAPAEVEVWGLADD